MVPPLTPASLHPIRAQSLGVADNRNPTTCDGRGIAKCFMMFGCRGLGYSFSKTSRGVAMLSAERFLARAVGVKSNITAHAHSWSQSVLLVYVIRRWIRLDLGHSEVGLGGIS
jgi:hypothetical protein